MGSRPSRETVTPIAGRHGTGRHISKHYEICVMQTTQKCMEIASKRGKANQEINKVYRMLKCKELYLIAYGKLSQNQGALTPGVNPEDTVDGMSIKRIDAIIDKLDKGCYEWKPSRRTYIDKKNSTQKRPLGMPTWSDKLLQEVMRMILEAYYEPQFRKCSHGFRPNRGCHTALKEINKTWTGTKWFIETDIKGCFDNINHDVLLEILSRDIRDERFLKLLKGMLEAGYMEKGIKYNTYSGTPQGGNISPLLANIVLNELDTYIEDELMPQYNIGNGLKRKKNPEYVRLQHQRFRAKKHNQKWIWEKAGKRMMGIPSKIVDDPEFKRLRYARYADDSILGLNGSKEDAEEIKRKIGQFLDSIKLEMSADKTLITHAGKGKARFLNYFISINWDNTSQTVLKSGVKRRSINGGVVLEMPSDVYNEWKTRVHGNKGKIMHRPELLYLSDYDIVSTYEVELQGLINYYILAHNVYKKGMDLRFFWQKSLLRTLAGKHKSSAAKIYRKYHYKTKDRNTVAVIVPRKGKKPFMAVFGRKPIERNLNAVIADDVKQIFGGRTQLIDRLLADKCEICGSREGVEVHHIKKLKDLQKKWQGRKEKPEWVRKMIAIRRKTLVVCEKHHDEIHIGSYDGKKLD